MVFASPRKSIKGCLPYILKDMKYQKKISLNFSQKTSFDYVIFLFFL